jgi:hypothetical protein
VCLRPLSSTQNRNTVRALLTKRAVLGHLKRGCLLSHADHTPVPWSSSPTDTSPRAQPAKQRIQGHRQLQLLQTAAASRARGGGGLLGLES